MSYGRDVRRILAGIFFKHYVCVVVVYVSLLALYHFRCNYDECFDVIIILSCFRSRTKNHFRKERYE